MKLNEIRNNPGAHRRKAKVGRGSSSGLGKTSGRGVKGAKARTGNAVYGFEGGQMPLYMRLPKRGFKNIFANDFAELSLGRLQKAIDGKKIDASAKITEDALRKAGLVRRSRDGIRLLGNGTLTAKVDIAVAGATAGARAAVEAAGGSLTATFQKKVYMNKKGEPGKRQQRRAKSAEKRAARQGATA
ncbi:MAG: 50S ribosomal protein L15 [Alphaproteobacteria bacterium]|jgi:large subunit ribosomal protein L15|nr:50S ribosomal protein L15 [Alphaproteobacteria bacterium]MBN9578119.1 50S ribosomal protein L15 [Alphaproteobacteria bacterium]